FSTVTCEYLVDPSLLFFHGTYMPSTLTLFPYTTLFRSADDGTPGRGGRNLPLHAVQVLQQPLSLGDVSLQVAIPPECVGDAQNRSEEHTSELQSRENLVCRLLLDKKKI